MNFKDILKRIKTNDLVLPDFQRGFVWEQDRMKRLYASILAKIPVGSILSLESQDDKFNCKQIGARPRSRILKKTKKKVDYLIDGQQRFTSLLAGFSTYYFENFFNAEKDIASNDLLCLYFVKFPAKDNENSEDIFGVRNLSFKERFFSSSEINAVIDSKYVFEISENVEKKQKAFEITNKKNFRRYL